MEVIYRITRFKLKAEYLESGDALPEFTFTGKKIEKGFCVLMIFQANYIDFSMEFDFLISPEQSFPDKANFLRLILHANGVYMDCLQKSIRTVHRTFVAPDFSPLLKDEENLNALILQCRQVQ